MGLWREFRRHYRMVIIFILLWDSTPEFVSVFQGFVQICSVPKNIFVRNYHASGTEMISCFSKIIFLFFFIRDCVPFLCPSLVFNLIDLSRKLFGALWGWKSWSLFGNFLLVKFSFCHSFCLKKSKGNKRIIGHWFCRDSSKKCVFERNLFDY